MKDVPASNELATDPPSDRFATARRVLRPLLAIPTPIIFLVAAAVATYALWRQGGLVEVGASLRSASPAGVAAILFAYSVSILALGVRWHMLVKLAGGAPRATSSAEVFLTSVIVNYAAPIGLAVPTRAALTVRDLGLTPMQSAAVVGWELILDVLALLVISAAWLIVGGAALMQSAPVDGRLPVVAGVVAVAGLAALIALSRVQTVRGRIGRLLGPMISQPRENPATAILAVALTGLFWGIQIGVMSGLLVLFSVVPTAPLVLGMMGLPVLIGMLSPVPGGAGVREALMVAAARLEGAPATPVILAAVAYRLALFIVTPVVWGAIKLARMWRDVR